MKFLILLCTLPLLAVASSYNEVVEEFDSASLYDFNCTAAGSFCSKEQKDCNTVFVCVPAGQNKWTVVKSKCDESKGETCNTGKCSATPSPLCANMDNKEFKCESLEGMYPDPFDCTTFHYCLPKNEGGGGGTTPSSRDVDEVEGGSNIELYEVQEEPVTSKCTDGYYYNPVTTYCDKRLVNGNCPTPPEVPLCKTLLQNGPLKSNRVLYYMCLPYDDEDSKLYPHLYMCPNGKKYQGNYKCV